jgi:hypothetical protein
MRVAAPIVFVLVAAVAAAAAYGAGISPGTADGRPGVTDRQAGLRYVTARAGAATRVRELRAGDGRVVRSRLVSGKYGIPLVTFSGDTAGLSPNGQLLVLEAVRASQQHLRKHSRFAVLRARTLTYARRIVLRGDFSFDALSPDGRRLFLIQHAYRSDVTRYAVRVYDLRSGRLAARAVVDKDEPNMAGSPIRRATGADGRWAYTLYLAAGGGAFIHALDTVGVRAVCIDLPAANAEAIGRARLVVDQGGKRLDVVLDGKTVYSVDLSTFQVTKSR